MARLQREPCRIRPDTAGDREVRSQRGGDVDAVDGKVAVTTGAAGGIGLGMAHAFADAGMRLVLADIDEQRLAEAVRDVRSKGASAIGVPTDVADRASIDALASATLERFGAVHLVCNNAGSPMPRSILEVTPDDWERGLGINLFGVVNGIQVFVPIFEEQGEGHINATSSMSGFVAFPPVVIYNVAKFGVIALMETLARELRSAGSPVEASVFRPGEVATHAIDNAMHNARLSGYEPSPDELAMVEAAQAGFLAAGMDPDDTGRIVLDGVRQGRFWIFSHPQWLEGPIRERFDAMVANGSLPDL